MKKADAVRKGVSKSYARALSEPGGGCCGGAEPSGGCCGPAAVEPRGVSAKLGGYDSAELADLPADAVVNAFGCGNPVAFSEIRAGETVLDLGSGAGIDLLLAARKVGPDGRVIGVDMTDTMIERARANVAKAGAANVEVRRGIIEELPVENASVDWVISNCVINLSPEKPRVFREIARVLKPGGRMLVSDIVAEELPDAIRRDPALYASCLAGAISEADYVAGLRAAGLTDVEVRQRLVYDRGQLEAFVASEQPQGSGCCGSGSSCCGGGDGDDSLVALAGSLQGRIWSARIFARKP